jgi:hypothetical protein
MLRAQEELEALRRHHVLDAKRQNIHLLVHRSLHLAPHLRGLLVLLAENTNTMVRARENQPPARRPGSLPHWFEPVNSS